MNPKTEKIDLGKRNVLIRELTPREIDAWLNGQEERQDYLPIFDVLYDGRLFTGDVVLLATDLTADEIVDIPPHQMEEICRKIRTLNPFFAGLLERTAVRPEPEPAKN